MRRWRRLSVKRFLSCCVFRRPQPVLQFPDPGRTRQTATNCLPCSTAKDPRYSGLKTFIPNTEYKESSYARLHPHQPRTPAPRPLRGLTKLPEFTLTSTDITDGGTAPTTMLSALFGVPGGQDLSPQLSWSGFPADTQSFVITCYDPDAPTPSGSGTGPYQTSRPLLPLLRRAQPHHTVPLTPPQ